MAKDTIPEEDQEFCRKVARLAREHGLHDMRMQFTPRSEWPSQIEMSWSQGRHGEDSGEVTLTSTVHIRQDIDVEVSK